MTLNDRRILFVHAHPDDETIGNGATMAKYAAEGVGVTLVTSNRGEMGEVLVPDLAHLAFEHDNGLGAHREMELADAMKILGVTDHRFLGGPGRFHDSGMAWAEDGTATVAPDVPEGAFWHADLLVASDLLVEIIREVRPQVLVTYDEFGGYGHPDHVQAHRVATYATSLAAVRSYKPELGEAWDIPKVYWSAMSKSEMSEGIRSLRAAGDTTSFEGWDPDNLPWGTEDEDIDAIVDAPDFIEVKEDAMRAHATQIAVDGPFFALSNNVGTRIWGKEFYRLAKGERGPVNADGFEEDLFAGL
jgi:N-acetyl-1-D-myo-inositol-2-amino-2-deoxy-alpha-D-glucopyranoside deacetylase